MLKSTFTKKDQVKYPGASSTDVIDHSKPSLREAPDERIIHSVTKDINNMNYLSNLSNVKKIVKLDREISKDTKLCFSSIICRTDIKDIDRKNYDTKNHLEKLL